MNKTLGLFVFHEYNIRVNSFINKCIFTKLCFLTELRAKSRRRRQTTRRKMFFFGSKNDFPMSD